MQDKLKPVAFLYIREDGSKDLVLDCNGEYARRLLELGATETPLYARPLTTNPVDDRETPVGDHQMVEEDEQIAREVMADWLGRSVDECDANSRGALLIQEGIRRYRQAIAAGEHRKDAP